ncbi:MAG: hypothetical protein BGO41_00125 [Clostridiales bacterium 38-18]|nr:MAG: hypothetical protein BGO41_00125 [Clostridiales bacterium 38-18]
MNEKPSLLMIQASREFTKSEVKIYDFIKEQLDRVIYLSLTELSEKCGVGDATILRFCRKIGYNGYQDFKLAIAQERSFDKELSNDSHFTARLLRNTQMALEDTLNLIEESVLTRVLNLIHQTADITIFGVGHSATTAYDLQSKLMRVGKQTFAYSDAHFQLMRASNMSSNSLVIAISITGSTKDIVDASRLAKEKGARVVAITSYKRSPLTEVADFVLQTSGKENPLDGGSMEGKISQLFMVDVICTGLSLLDLEHAKKCKEAASEAVTNKLY